MKRTIAPRSNRVDEYNVILKELLNLKYEKNLSLEEHLLKFDELIRIWENENEERKCDEETKINYLLLSLPERYESLHEALNTPNGPKTFEFVKQELRNEETRNSTSVAWPFTNELGWEGNNLRYKMNHKYRGIAAIFILNEDEAMPESVLHSLGFDVRIIKGLNKDEVLKKFKNIAKENHFNNDCFAVFVLGYSECDDYQKTFFEIFLADNCKSLAGKPKLLFIQVSQGCESDSEPTNGDSYTIPLHSDFLVAYSTYPKKAPIGPLFVPSLCSVLKKYAYNYDLLTLLTLVNKQVALKAKEQVPLISFTLIREFRFSQKEVPSTNQSINPNMSQ